MKENRHEKTQKAQKGKQNITTRFLKFIFLLFLIFAFFVPYRSYHRFMNFIFNLTRREIRSSWRRLLFFFLCIAIGVGSVVALRSLVQNLSQAVGTDARALLTADLEISSTNDFSPTDIQKSRKYQSIEHRRSAQRSDDDFGDVASARRGERKFENGRAERHRAAVSPCRKLQNRGRRGV
jgi:hypothetical protein